MNRVHRTVPATALNSAILHRHALHEDVLAIFTGACLISLGVVIQAQAQLLSGGIAGLSMFVARLAPVGFWIAFFVFNLPFCALAWRRGGGFVVRTLLAVTLTAALTERTAVWTGFAMINPIYAAVAGGALIGIGLIVLFRHGTSLGGLSILALYLQDRVGIRAGYVQMAFDAALLLIASSVLPAWNLVLSVLGMLTVNAVIAAHHRSDRYVGVTGRDRPRTGSAPARQALYGHGKDC